MKKCYLDSNFLVYLKNEDSPFFPRAKEELKKLVSDKTMLFISPLVIDEFLHAFCRGLINKESKDFYENLSKLCADILQLPLLIIINPPTDSVSQLRVVGIMKNYSLRSRDAYHLLIMQSNNIDAFATFDTDFRRVFAAKIIKKVL